MPETLDLRTDPLPVAVQPGAPDGAHFMPSGHWVVLADPRILKRRDRKEIIRKGNETESSIESGWAVTEAVLTKLITAWSYPFPIPAEDPASLEEVDGEDDTALMELIEPAQQLLFPKPPSPDDDTDERSPTGPSGE
jgi:hypothetical protein